MSEGGRRRAARTANHRGLLRNNGLSSRMDREGQPHDGMKIVWAGRDGFFIDVAKHVGKRFMRYADQHPGGLFAAADRRKTNVLTEVENVQPTDVTSEHPYFTFTHDGEIDRS